MLQAEGWGGRRARRLGWENGGGRVAGQRQLIKKVVASSRQANMTHLASSAPHPTATARLRLPSLDCCRRLPSLPVHERRREGGVGGREKQPLRAEVGANGATRDGRASGPKGRPCLFSRGSV